MKNLFPILTVILALFASPIVAQDGDGAAAKSEVEPTVTEAVEAEEAPASTEEAKPTWETAGDSGDTAWMTTAAVLVLFMTIPGLSLFYGGLVRSKNYLSILVQCFAITCLMSFLWIAYGYGWSAEGGGNYFGDFANRVFLGGYEFLNLCS